LYHSLLMSERRRKFKNYGEAARLPAVFALDMPWSEGQLWIERLSADLWGFKVGSILFTEQGPEVVRHIKNKGARVFLDLKYHDIPATVGGAVQRAFDLGVDWLTVHAAGGPSMLQEAAKHQTDQRHVFAVTALTSLETSDLRSVSVEKNLETYVEDLAGLAVESGIHGIVSSVHELPQLRGKFVDQLLLTPGVRFEKTEDDQKRTATATEAFEQGADYIVLGRALSKASDWEKTWQKIKSTLAETS
jgi:orotidine-5'-phosphate decarboxylase